MEESSVEDAPEADVILLLGGVAAVGICVALLFAARSTAGTSNLASLVKKSPAALLFLFTWSALYAGLPGDKGYHSLEKSRPVRASVSRSLPLASNDVEAEIVRIAQDADISVRRLSEGFVEATHGLQIGGVAQAGLDTMMRIKDASLLDLAGAREEVTTLEPRCYWFKTSHCSPQGLVEGVSVECSEPVEPRQSGFCSCYGVAFYGKTCHDSHTNVVCETFCKQFLPNSTAVRGPHVKEAEFMQRYFNKSWGGGKLRGRRPPHVELLQRFHPSHELEWGVSGGASAASLAIKSRHAWRGDEVSTSQGLVRLSGFKKNRIPKQGGEGAVVMLSNTRSLPVLLQTLRTYESTVNVRLHHAYVIFFPPRQRFTNEFKTAVTDVVSGDVYFISIDETMWDPLSVRRMQKLKAAALETPSRLSNHPTEALLATRFFSMGFYAHPAMERFDYFFRLTEEVAFLCNVYFDPFALMHQAGKNYAFSLVYTNMAEKELGDKQAASKVDSPTSPPDSSRGDHDSHLQSVYALLARYLVARAWRDTRVYKESKPNYAWVQTGRRARTTRGLTAFIKKVKRFFQQRESSAATFFNEVFGLMDEFSKVFADEIEAVAQTEDDPDQTKRFNSNAEVNAAGKSDESTIDPAKVKKDPVPSIEDNPYFFASAFFDLVMSDDVRAEGWLDAETIFDPTFRDLLGIPTYKSNNPKQRGLVFEEALRNCEFFTLVEMGGLSFFRDSTGYHDLMHFVDQSGYFLSEDFADSTYRTIGVHLFAPLHSIYHYEPLSFSHNGFFQIPTDTTVCSSFPIPDSSYSSTGFNTAACTELLSGLADP